MSYRCDICNVLRARSFQLTIRAPRPSGHGMTTRGVGSIRLCAACWKSVTKGHRRRVRREGYCLNDLHPMVGYNVLTNRPGRRSCRACAVASQKRGRERQRLLHPAKRPWSDERRRAYSELMTRWAADRREREMVA